MMMELSRHKFLAVSVLFLVCRYTAAQGGCTPAPPSSLALIVGVDTDGGVPFIFTPAGGEISYIQVQIYCVVVVRAGSKGWRTQRFYMVGVQCDPDTAAWSVVSG